MNKHGCQYLRALVAAVVTALTATSWAQVEVEYFIDTDPGIGQALRFSVSPDADGSVSFSPSTHDLQPGQHTLGWRAFRMSDGKRLYGPTLTQEFLVPRVDNPALVTRAEYFWDNDPGHGQGTPIVIVGGAEVNLTDIELSTVGLPAGNHLLGIRACGGEGWGPTLRQEIYVPRSMENDVKVTRVEYFFDSDPGIGQGTPIAIAAAKELNLTDVEVSTAGLSYGVHQMGIRAFGDSGWGPTVLQEFNVTMKEADMSLLSAEYFIDTDPGFGQGTPISITSRHEATFDGLGLSLSGLSQGNHLLGVRYRGTNGWSATFTSDFFLSEGDGTSVTNAEYFYDVDPGFGQGTPISITAGQEVTVDGLGLSTSDLPQGRHLLGVRYRGPQGWSVTYMSDFYNIKGDGGTIATAEYFWDVDPGYGQGTPACLTPGEEVTLEDLCIPAHEIHGDAVLYIRYRGPQGWSPTLGFAIVVEAEGTYTLNALAATDAATRTYQTLGDALSEFADRGVGADITVSVTTSDTNYALDATGETVLATFAALGESLGTTASPRTEKAIAFTAAEGSGNTLSITTTAEGLPTVVDALTHTSMENVALTINGTAYDFSTAVHRHQEIYCNQTTTAVALGSISTAITATWTAQPHQGTAIGGYQASGEGDLPAMTLTCTGTKQDSIAYAITLSDADGQTLCSYTYYIYVQPRVDATDFVALQQLYADFDGATWNGKKWNTTDNLITPDNWSGVTFDGTGRVAAIDLSSRGLTGHTLNAATLAPMTALRSLKLNYNQIDEVTGPLPATITTLELSYQHRKSGSSATMLGLESLPTQTASVGQNTGITLPNVMTYNHAGQNFNEHPTLKVYTTAYTQVGTLTWAAVNEAYTFAPSGTQVTLGQDADVVLIAGSGCGANSAIPATLHFVAGDANLSGLVDVNDVQRTLNYVLNTSGSSPFGLWSANTYTQYETDPVINIQDIVCTVDIVLDEQNGAAVKAYRANESYEINRTYETNMTYESDEAPNLFYSDGRSIMLESTEDIAAFDLELEGVSASQVRLMLSGRDWQMSVRGTARGVRLVVFSPTGETLPAGATELLRLSADGVPTNVQASSPEAETVEARVNDGVPTGIASVRNSEEEAVYDLSGKMVNGKWSNGRLPRGIYIIAGKKIAK